MNNGELNNNEQGDTIMKNTLTVDQKELLESILKKIEDMRTDVNEKNTNAVHMGLNQIDAQITQYMTFHRLN